MATQGHKNISPDRRIPGDSHISFPQVALKERFHSLIDMWFKRQVSRLGVRQKLIYSYALIAGFLLLVVLAGRSIEIKYRQDSLTRIVLAEEKLFLVNELEKTVLKTQIQQQRLLLVLDNPQDWKQASARLLASTDRVKQLLYQTTSVIDRSETYSDSLTPRGRRYCLHNLTSHQNTVTAYSQQLETLLQPGLIQNLTPQQQSNLKQALIVFASSQAANNFNNLAGELQNLVELLHADKINVFPKIESENILLSRQILAATILVTVLLATTLIFYTTRAIAFPLESVKKVAQQAIQDANFTMPSYLHGGNEETSLATVLHILILQMKKYHKELEQAHQTLEKHVTQQYQEILQKDEELSLNRQNLQKIQAQVIQAEKMSSLGHMVAGIAHEINNPVSFVYGNIKYAQDYVTRLLSLIDLYEQQYPQPTSVIEEHRQEIELDFIADDLPKILASMQMGTQRVRELVISLRNFSRLDEELVQNVDLHVGINDTLLILNNRLKKGINVIKEYGDLPLIECYPAQLNQVFMNIINNAIDELLGFEELEYKEIKIHTQLIAPNEVQVRIQDNGSGIPPHIKDKIFEPFFTTKPVGKGTGLGLSISHQIIAKHHGKLQINSPSSNGCEFILSIPVQQLL
jgi:signal transduction histidine kinase